MDRVGLLGHLVGRYSTKEQAATYTVQEKGATVAVVFAYPRPNRKTGKVGTAKVTVEGKTVDEAARLLWDKLAQAAVPA